MTDTPRNPAALDIRCILIGTPGPGLIPAMRAASREARNGKGSWLLIAPPGTPETTRLGSTTALDDLLAALGGTLLVATKSALESLEAVLERNPRVNRLFVEQPRFRSRPFVRRFRKTDLNAVLRVAATRRVPVAAAPQDPPWPLSDLWVHRAAGDHPAQAALRILLLLLFTSALSTGLSVSNAPAAAHLLLALPVMYAAGTSGLLAGLLMVPLVAAGHDWISHTFAPQVVYSLADYLTALPVLAAIALISAVEAWRLRQQVERVRRHDYEIRALFRATRALAEANDPETLPDVIVRQIARALQVTAHLWEHTDTDTPRRYGGRDHGGDDNIEPSPVLQGLLAARSAEELPDPERPEVPDARLRLLPLTRRDGAPACALALHYSGEISAPGADIERLIDSLCDLVALALDRRDETREINEARVLKETETLRAALLSSISHDLGTPLASIIGSASSLLTNTTEFSEADRRDLLETIVEEAQRLHRFVTNLLQITRVEAGVLSPKLEVLDAEDLIETLLERAGKRTAQTPIDMVVQGLPPLVRVDVVLMETVLGNLLGNAVKYGRPGGTVRITLGTDDAGNAVIAIADDGDGIPPEDLERIFDKFYRVKSGDRVVAGTGLGLAICRGIMDSLNGTIHAVSAGRDKGTTFVLTLPPVPPATDDAQRTQRET